MATFLRLTETEQTNVKPNKTSNTFAANHPNRSMSNRNRFGYSLTTALLVVRNMETQATRNAVFSEIKNKNLMYKLVDWAYALSGFLMLQPIVLFIYMLKCVASVGPKVEPETEAVSIENFGNEANSIERVMSLMPSISTARMALKRKHYLVQGQFSACLLLIKALPRFWGLIQRLASSHGFMPACRIASVLAYYIRFNDMFMTHRHLKTVLIASNYSPECVALAAAAHNNGRKIIYINHAPVPSNSPYVPPVLSDYAVFYGEAVENTYKTRSRCIADVTMIGQSGKTLPITWQPSLKTIGIFLTALTRTETIEKLVKQIKLDCPETNILIRHHPVSLLETDFSSLLEQYPDIRTTIGTDLNQDIADCDLVFCGNSGVAMNILCSGKPVAYLKTLDRLPHDYIGFVANGLVYEVNDWNSEIYEQLRQFYKRDKWQKVMQKYDASYGSDKEKLLGTVQEKLARWI